ncbi:MAG: arginine--tRNA ligase [Alphaproteobacteria bacterium]|nr:arginine--tRNA ligase [Alphaproteobacteria bacterium]PHY00378.1 MAG: arginine--tRNA ligase [Rhodospirillaceae bacterium]
MNIFNLYKDRILGIVNDLVKASALPQGLDLSKVAAEPPRDAAHGDIATNVAMVLSKPVGKNPREIAALLTEPLKKLQGVTEVSIAGPGFINLRLVGSTWANTLRHVLTIGTKFGDGDVGQGAAVNVEYVSANPTGPMHVGHARGAVVGDALARLLAKAGFKVTKEYYINDAGGQVNSAARAVRMRYLQVLGRLSEDEFQAALARKEIEYGGAYLIPIAETLAKRDGDKWAAGDESAWLAPIKAFVVAEMMVMIKDDLAALGVQHDLFTSEKALVDSGKVNSAVKFLENAGLMYTGILEPPKGKTPDDWEARPQRLFKATEFGDEIDRPLQKSDGSWTYFAGDIAYHKDKVDRGFFQLINVWGADHGGYVKRVQAALKALTAGKGELDVVLCQMVKVLNNGEPVKMSKRAGNFVTMRDLIDAVGKDVVRFIMLTRKSDAGLDFDYAKVTEKTRDNPVFYVQYAHARGRSVFRHAKDMWPSADFSDAGLAQAQLDLLQDPDEIGALRLMAAWPRIVEQAALTHEPHRVAFYLNDLASQFHGLWNKGNDATELRFLQADNQAISLARLALVRGVGLVIASGLDVYGVEPVEEMR